MEQVSTPNGTGDVDAVNAFASILAVEDGEPKQGEAQPESEAKAEADADEAGTQDESEAGKQAADEESESGDGEQSEEVERKPDIYRVKVDGSDVEVTLDELQKGYSRTQDYTRKTQVLAEQRKAIEAELDAVRMERAQYAQTLKALEQQLSQADAQPDWDKLYQENPTEWVRQRELWRDKQDRANAVKAEQARVAAIQQQELGKLRQAQLSEEAQKLKEAIPEWKDSKVAAEERGKLFDTAKRVGFTDNELNEIFDHRAVVLLRKAALYDELVGKKAQIKPAPTKGPKPAVPGSAATKPSKKSEAQAAQERLAKSGSMKDAAAAFDQFI